MKLLRKNTCVHFLSALMATFLFFNMYVLRKIFEDSKQFNREVMKRAIWITTNGSLKINLAGLLQPANKPSFDYRQHSIINEHKYNYINKPSGMCAKMYPTLLIATVSSIMNFDRRRLARRTQMSIGIKNVILLFFLGKSVYLTGLQQRVNIEAKQYGDIVQEDFEDSERNLTLKSISILRWVNDKCPNVRYVIKKDDDVNLNIGKALNALLVKEREFQQFVLGNSKYLVEGPIRDELSKYYTSFSEYKERFFPMFVHGPAYGFPGKTATLLFQVTQRTQLFWLEDVYITGICTYLANIPVFFDKGFSYSHFSGDVE